MDERKRFVVDAFLTAATRKSNRTQSLQNGLVLRNQFQQALVDGKVPLHPRWEWLRRQSRTLLELVIGCVKDYEKANPGAGDRASMADAMDIAQMTTANIQEIVQANILDPDQVELLPFEEVKPEDMKIESTPAEEDEEEDEEEDDDE